MGHDPQHMHTFLSVPQVSPNCVCVCVSGGVPVLQSAGSHCCGCGDESSGPSQRHQRQPQGDQDCQETGVSDFH